MWTQVCFVFFPPPSLRKKSSTTSVLSSLQMLARRRRGRGWKMNKHLLPRLERVLLCHWAVVKTLKAKSRKMKSLPPKPPHHPTRTSPLWWKGSGPHNPVSAPAPDREGSGGHYLGVWDLTVLTPLIRWWPHGSYQDLTLHLRRGAVGPAPTPTSACCLTVRCASTPALLLLSQVWFHFATHCAMLQLSKNTAFLNNFNFFCLFIKWKTKYYKVPYGLHWFKNSPHKVHL